MSLHPQPPSHLLLCRRHKKPVTSIYSLLNSQYGNIFCDQCKSEIGEAVFDLLRPNTFPLKEFLEEQNHPQCEQKILFEVHKSLVDRQQKLKEISSFNEEQLTSIEKDFAQIFKMFMAVSDMAKKYLKERVDSNFKRLTENYKFLVNNYKMVSQKCSNGASAGSREQTVSGSNTEEIIRKLISKNASVNQLRHDVLNFSVEMEKHELGRVAYKKTENSQKFFLDINNQFEKAAKEHFRKFKRFLENAKTGIPINLNISKNSSSVNVSNSEETMYASERSQLMPIAGEYQSGADGSMLGIAGNTSLDTSFTRPGAVGSVSTPASRAAAEPEARRVRATKKLLKFPEISNINIVNAIQQYGEFSVNLDHPIFKDIPETEPLLLEDNSIYKGQWKDQKRVGRGQCLTVDGSYIDGYWTNDLPDILCRIIHKNGDVYEGYVKDGLAHGRGVFLTQRNYRYIGQWVYNMRHGTGEEIMEDGSQYKGEFLCDVRHGNGELVMANGMRFSGSFVSGHICGKGVATWSDGTMYDGEWAEGKKNGKGKYQFKNGDLYNGDFVADFPHGFGELTKKEGEKIMGCWEMGQPKGFFGSHKSSV